MRTQTRVFVTFFVLVVLIVGIYLFSDWFSKATGYALGEDQKIAFATCLVSKGVVLYETPDCLACEQQRTLLGESAYDLIPKQRCTKETRCNGLKEIPAWELEGVFSYGKKTYEQLDALSSCDIGPTN